MMTAPVKRPALASQMGAALHSMGTRSPLLMSAVRMESSSLSPLCLHGIERAVDGEARIVMDD
jgi:hypothetical protein